MAWSSLWSYFIGTLHCLLVDICLADRQRETATYYTHIAFGLALSLSRKELMNKRHDLYLISLLWVVVFLCIYAQYQSISRLGIYLQVHDPASIDFR